MNPVAQLPFSAVVGQEEAKLALLLTAVDHRVGGVLLRGEKGSAKSTLARGLASLLPGAAPFVELPVGATEDRVVGTLDLAAALTGGEVRFSPGLLAAADGGVLYVDEINLLPDHLVDVLLDAAASGVNRVEREGVSHSHPARFLLIGSMNPEEGELRPQLLDRFGLAVDVVTATDVDERATALRRRLAFDDDPPAVTASFAASEAALAARLAAARPATLPDGLIASVSALCASLGSEGLRGDLTVCRAAGALAGWEGRAVAGAADVRRVAPLALAHRARRDPLQPAGLDRAELEERLDEHVGGSPPDAGPGTGTPSEPGTGDVCPPDPGAGGPVGGSDRASGAWSGLDPSPPAVGPRARPRRPAGAPASSAAGRRGPAPARRGRVVGDRPVDPGNGLPSGVALGATVRRAAERVASAGRVAGDPVVGPGDVREAVREDPSASLVVIAVDASGSMGARERVEAAKGAVLALLLDAYQRRDLVSLVSFRGDRADVLLRPTGSVEVARARLADLPTGGRTPLAAGILSALELATAPGRAGTHRPLLVLITDGRATAGPEGDDPLEAALRAAAEVRRRKVDALVVDVEGSAASVRLGLARSLAERMGAVHVPLDRPTPDALGELVRSATLR